MNNHEETIFQDAGFKLPAPCYMRKPDLRGNEYGEFRVYTSPDKHLNRSEIVVEYWGYPEITPNEPLERMYTMFFKNTPDFKAWAKENT